MRTPLLRLDLDEGHELYLKLENLQPIGSFKIRGAASRLLSENRDDLSSGVWTASAGNMAQGVAWCARLLGIPCTVVVPESAPAAKLEPLVRMGAAIEKVTREEFFAIFSAREKPGLSGRFVHAFSDPEVMAGNATIGLEILEDLPSVSAVYIPFGGGGLSCGIGSVIKESSPGTRVITCEPSTAAPLAASLRSGKPVPIEFRPSFVDGAGGPYLYPEMFQLAREVIDDALEVPLQAAADAVRFLCERAHIVAEGAGALGVAAAMARSHEGPVVCVISGGNINTSWLRSILAGSAPTV